MQPLSSLMEAVTNLLGPRRAAGELAVCLWPEVVGEPVAAHTRAQAYRDGTLWVVCDSPVWAQELSLQKPRLLQTLAARIGPAAVVDIRFSAGVLGPLPPGPMASGPPLPAVRPGGRERAVAAGLGPALEAPVAGALAAAGAVRQRRLAEGWQACRRCGGLMDGPAGGLCGACAGERDRAVRRVAEASLLAAPWLSHADLARIDGGLTERIFREVRAELRDKWKAKLTGRGRVGWKEAARCLVMLESGLPPEAIDAEVIRTVLGEDIGGRLEKQTE